ncbi:hypothetical protein [Jannaschia rubra]|uniref:Uncharacterized protein n=1 Tax=Jannaschia rubra TaxID=282197 RepID=A0A0M6XQC9_9RHOB|nr:hypothetical protein [Jannaschia rubra]CTQ33339.1 hypothetical protein JAN5088_02121 [Jannaschia rubra]SFF99537.1 type VI secretion system protein ImpK [Jannaschia rubra]
MAGCDDDKDRTVFGQPLPRPADAPRAVPRPGSGGTQAPPGDRTVIGGALPGQRGGLAPPQQPAQPYPQQQPYGQPAPFGGAAPNSGLFPELPRQDAAPDRVEPRISLQDALRPSGLAQTAIRNPIVRAASDLLILLGRLRTGLVEM